MPAFTNDKSASAAARALGPNRPKVDRCLNGAQAIGPLGALDNLPLEKSANARGIPSHLISRLDLAERFTPDPAANAAVRQQHDAPLRVPQPEIAGRGRQAWFPSLRGISRPTVAGQRPNFRAICWFEGPALRKRRTQPTLPASGQVTATPAKAWQSSADANSPNITTADANSHSHCCMGKRIRSTIDPPDSSPRHATRRSWPKYPCNSFGSRPARSPRSRPSFAQVPRPCFHRS